MISITDWHSFFFYLFALVTCVFGLAVLFSNHIVHMAFYLIVSLGASAGLFILAGAEFVGAMQLLIYVGGTLVLLIFGVMLTAQERFVSMKTRGGEWVVAAIVGGALLMLLVRTAFSIEDWSAPRADAAQVSFDEAETTTQLGLGLLGVRSDKVLQPDEQLHGGMSGYLLLFEIASVHLLIVLIGAAYLARTKRYAPAAAGAFTSTAPGYEGARREAPTRRRARLATAWAVLGLAGAVTALIYFALRYARPEAGEYIVFETTVPWWFVAGHIALLAGIIVALSALLGWQRWGYYAAWVLGLAGAALNWYVIDLACGVGTLLVVAAYLVVLSFLLKAGGARSMWAQLE
jgi:NADH-quinone oxidoreductase subunit J